MEAILGVKFKGLEEGEVIFTTYHTMLMSWTGCMGKKVEEDMEG